MAKRTNYQGEKRSKELNRLKKQTEKKERKKNNENDQPDDMVQTDDISQPENELPPIEIVSKDKDLI